MRDSDVTSLSPHQSDAEDCGEDLGRGVEGVDIWVGGEGGEVGSGVGLE